MARPAPEVDSAEAEKPGALQRSLRKYKWEDVGLYGVLLTNEINLEVEKAEARACLSPREAAECAVAGGMARRSDGRDPGSRVSVPVP